MSLIDELRAARSNPPSVLFQLLLTYRPAGGTLHAFFEGQDEESYFTNFLRAYLPADYALHGHRCRGKAGVVSLFRQVDRRKYDLRRLLFFVDRDYADILGEAQPADENIYVTDHYAIENHVAEPEVLRRYLRDILHLDDAETEALIVRRFEEQRARFYRHMLPICAWTIFVMRLGLRPNLSDIRLHDLFRVTTDLQVQRLRLAGSGTLKYLDEATGISTPPGCWAGVRAVAAELHATWPPKAWTRGKFEMWMFVEFARRIPELLNRQDVGGRHRVIVRTHMNQANAMEILGPRAALSTSLKAFLDHHFARLPH